eukprot:TRINITY_DN24777_c0_g1_i3.p1 TRINITY_DN24777_c0_g1~~TRINITY_DN24777_c0_g1_i3.p1  ORF type:complete len:295 (-),score=3.72 TRINITY_DN24777_c0_g1_i3:426-1310(-)
MQFLIHSIYQFNDTDYHISMVVQWVLRNCKEVCKYESIIEQGLKQTISQAFLYQPNRTHVTVKKSHYLFRLRAKIYNNTCPTGKPGIAKFYIPPTKDQIFDRHRTRAFSYQEKEWRQEVKAEIREHFVGRKSNNYHKRIKERYERKFPHRLTSMGRYVIRQPPKEANLPLPRWGVATDITPDQSTRYAPRVKRKWSPEDYDMDVWRNKIGSMEQVEVLNFKLDYSKNVLFRVPTEVKALVLEPTLLCLYGVDKTQVDRVASKIRALQPPNIYTGQGIRLLGEKVVLRAKAGQKK